MSLRPIGGYCKHNVPGGVWCDECDGPGSFAASAGSLAHVHFEITTAAGNRAVITGDPNMPDATRNALAQMIDALAKAVERGDFKKPENCDYTTGRCQ